MGNPNEWYEIFLRYLAKALSEKRDYESIMLMAVDQLEQYITDKRPMYDEKRFFYLSGTAAHATINDAFEIGSDAATACAGGLWDFEHFIGL